MTQYQFLSLLLAALCLPLAAQSQPSNPCSALARTKIDGASPRSAPNEGSPLVSTGSGSQDPT